MTIIAGFSWSRHGLAPLQLAAQIAHSTGESVVATAIVERPWPPKGDPIEDEYLRYVTAEAERSLVRAVEQLPADLDISVVVHQSTSVPKGLIEVTTTHDASLVVVGSSSAGLMGRVALGSVTEWLVHTAAIPVAIAPRGYPQTLDRVTRLTAAYGGDADIEGLVPAIATLGQQWSTALRIASFTVRPVWMSGGALESSAESLVVAQWSRRMQEEAARQLELVREHIHVGDVDVVVGSGHDWREAVEDITWEPGDVLVLGSGAAGQASRVFLGSAASKILRHSPVPTMIVPRHQLPIPQPAGAAAGHGGGGEL
ncbi:universal stress protein [Millisia brevis]|uniref:universal stress protein n=1 Tax=Millisia brevis TaxID=264148 RepID=UPI000832C9C5|nr:universal stress protein [Millisia brevis]